MAVEIRCPNCGVDQASGARFCSSCGEPLDRGPRREERKLVSVLFVDLVGFTARSDQADPEDVRDALGVYHAEARRRIEEHGGTLEKFAGDAVMAVFGAPVAHGDDAERAVRAGLAVLGSLEELNRAHGLDLAARAAVNTGDAVVAIGSDRGETLAIGDVVNTASRLQTAAPEGRLVVGEETYRATRNTFAYDSMDAVEAKGKARRTGSAPRADPRRAPRSQAQRRLQAASHVSRREGPWRQVASSLLSPRPAPPMPYAGPLAAAFARLPASLRPAAIPASQQLFAWRYGLALHDVEGFDLKWNPAATPPRA